MKALLILSILFFVNPQSKVNSDQVLGRWMSEGKDLEVEVFKVDDRYAARIVWFECNEATPRKLAAHRDTENPNPKLRGRSWLGRVVVDDLQFDKADNEWSGGNIYDPNSGHTFKSVARLSSPHEMVVRGYWGFEVFGKSVHFSRVEK
ncbi:hypothetical protein GCM10027275_49460 [Rhabdobacter roseus]|uniref:Uncharacterized protein (DUF2147 family) n=1 Tax=Rhabdobacter roseus TaxID=1655419 RepID=A0A840TZP8_9BACT|nr:DUF2147 domain-containing protein [Rhabdobacter roseus]MBB5287007.1 uncharacterized protein (DUF2147 family) [Rhabdobacter roseus]